MIPPLPTAPLPSPETGAPTQRKWYHFTNPIAMLWKQIAHPPNSRAKSVP